MELKERYLGIRKYTKVSNFICKFRVGKKGFCCFDPNISAFNS